MTGVDLGHQQQYEQESFESIEADLFECFEGCGREN